MVATVTDIKEFLSNPGNIAIIGASSNSSKAGYYVPKYLQSLGFKIYPVNPSLKEFLGETCVPSLEDLENVDLVGVIIYRRTEDAEIEAMKAISMKIPMIWLPDRIRSEKAEVAAEQLGLKFVHDDCPLRRGRNLLKN